MELRVPALSVVVLVGPSGSGKSTFARKHFLPTEIVSSDACRALVADDENDQSATPQAFELLHAIVEKRLALGRLVVVDATNVEPLARKALVALAKKHHVLAVAVVLDLPERLCAERANRPDRPLGAHVVRHQARELHRGLGGIGREGFSQHWILRAPEQLDAASVTRAKLWNDRRDDRGPFDVVGDVHGCLDELHELLGRLGYRVEGTEAEPVVTPPPGRKLIFLGDLVDRGPKIAGVLRLAMHMVKAGSALCVPGNHEAKLQRWLLGKQVKVGHGLAATIAELEREPQAFRDEVLRFIDGLVSHLVLDGGELVVAHAGLRAELQGRASGVVREFCLYGDTTGEIDAYGLPVRADWALGYRGRAAVVYGHTPVPAPEWVNRTLCVDTGCVFGGALTALRWPERELVSVKAQRVHFEPVRPIAEAHAPRAELDLLEIGDVAGKRFVHTRYQAVRLREENAAPALEVMSRFVVAPGWLVHLPPTMSPCETAAEGPLEQPDACFAYFRAEGVRELVCEEKHMGSRAIVVLARTPEAAARRFHERGGREGAVYTRTGRPFFTGRMEGYERALVARLQAAAEAAGLWRELATDWMVLDTELLPWSAKAQELLRRQYAPVGAAAEAALSRAVALASGTSGELAGRLSARLAAARAYRAAYRRYSWDVRSLDDLVIAPFHLLASEGAVHVDRDHGWHLEVLGRLAAVEPRLVRATRSELVDLDDPASVERATRWWQELTASGGEGMVVKPKTFLARGAHGLVQPAVKCRGAEYLRIIYGPEYDLPENLPRLRARRLGGKRALALREVALGLEALHRFVEGEPLHRVHECVFGVLALESEPVDPRL